MNNLTFAQCVVLFILIITIISCKKDENVYPSVKPSFGKASLLINGVQFNVTPYARTSNLSDTLLGLTLAYRSKEMFERAHLSFSKVPKTLGYHRIITGTGAGSLGPGLVMSTYLDDGHIVGDLFRYDQSLGESYLNLGMYNSITNEVAGEFDVKLIRSDEEVYSPEFPDTLKITGTFNTKIDYK